MYWWSRNHGLKRDSSQTNCLTTASRHASQSPDICPNVSDDGIQGQREQTLRVLAIELAEGLIAKAERRST
jgi:hypothetical protein